LTAPRLAFAAYFMALTPMVYVFSQARDDPDRRVDGCQQREDDSPAVVHTLAPSTAEQDQAPPATPT
jgi:hypothetical protein